MKIELHERLGDAFEPTPEGFHHQVTNALRHPKPVKRRGLRAAAVFALCIALLCGSAVALDRIGVLYFLTNRHADGPTAVWMRTEGTIVVPDAQQCESSTLNMSVRDVYLSADEIAVCVHIAPMEPESCRLLSQTDIGTDGENFDRIWWNGEILTFEEWLPEGKQMLVVDKQYMEIGTQRVLCSMDWVPEETGETFLFTVERWQLDDDLLLNSDGTLTLRIAVDSYLYGTESRETSILTCTVPIVEEWKEEEP